MRIELRHADRGAHARVELVGKRRGRRLPLGLRPEVRELLALQETLPVQDVDGHALDASLVPPGCPPCGLRSHPSNLIRLGPAKGVALVKRALTIAGSDSGGGAGIQADLKAFAAAGTHGATAVVALTAQSTVGVTAVHELPPAFVVAQLDAVFSDLGVDAAKTGMLFSRTIVETVADYLATHRVPLVVDPVMIASSGARLLQDDAVDALVARLFPLATVVTPNLAEAQALCGGDGRASKAGLAEALVGRGARAALVTGGHGTPVDHLYDGREHTEIEVERLDVPATHGAGCTHSATLTALLARGLTLADAARGAARAATEAVRNGLTEIGAGDGPVDVLDVKGRL
jgi:hydroxymethylpyrimidine/phosphomethylpyrimidine kinase